MTGTTVTHYRILDKLGEGGMGVVYKAEDTALRRTVALKFLPSCDEDSRQRFLHEAQAAAALNHPNICTIHEIDQQHGFLAMELVEGKTIKQRIAERPFKFEEALDIALQSGCGLQAAHEKGIAHRDIKPANLALTAQGVLKIMDFGLARISDRTRLTKTGVAVGTPAYMSPEQAEGKLSDHRADIWALGVLIYEMLAGRPPFPGESDQAVTYALVHTEPEPLTSLRSGLPIEIDRVLAKAMAKKPEERYQHMADLLVDLRSLAQRSESSRAVSKPARTMRRAPLLGAALAGVLITLFAVRFIPPLREIAAPTESGLPPEARFLALTTYTGNDREGALAPNGNTFAFVSNMGGQPDIWVRQVAGGEPVQLTKDSAAESQLIFSPDGEWIYYTSRASIWRIGALGGAPRKIVDEANFPAPSGDNKSLGFLRRSSIAVVSLDGGAPRIVLERTDMTSLRWSPDGRRFAFISAGLMAIYQVWVVDSNGANLKQLTQYQHGLVSGLGWTQDSRNLLVARSNDPSVIVRSTDLWLVPLHGGPHHRLTMGAYGRLVNPHVSASGSRILVSYEGFDGEIVRVPLAGGPDENGRAATQLVAGASDPMWIHMPHGTSSLLVNSIATGIRNLWIYPLDQVDKPRQATMFMDSYVSHASLSPDAIRVAYSSNQTGNAEIWVANIDGSGAIQLTHDPAPDFWPVWSPDGKWIMFGSSRTVIPRKLYKVPSTGGATHPMTKGNSYRGDWSPKGDRIAYWGDRGIEVLDLATSNVVARFPDTAGAALPVFSPDGGQVSYAGPGETVWIGDISSGKTRMAIRFPEPGIITFRICWTPDGKSVIVNLRRPVSHIALLDNVR
ncbi:MAG: PD40 domain-containing protein [Acidobacteriia bacterium]|nr:PD40 domain-containing protein [Terriglobia bacterium]